MSHDGEGSGPVFPEVEQHLVKRKQPVIGRVIRSEPCQAGKSASFVRHVEVDVSGTPLANKFRVGQSFGVVPPGADATGRPHNVRLYSIAAPSWGEDGAGNVVSTTVKRVIDEYKPEKPGDRTKPHTLFLGVCSNYLCDLQVGDEVAVTGPSGRHFLLPSNPDAHDYVFVATGTGIAPFRGMLLELLQRKSGPCGSRMHLLMGSPYRSDLLYHDLFTGLAQEHPNFRYHTAISREPMPGSRRGLYVHELLGEEPERFAETLKSPRTLVYVCGLQGMQVGLYQTLVRLGLHEGYLQVAPELAGTDPLGWAHDQVTRRVRSTKRMLVEVY
jgi:ferredoxin--NADP+ reductase